MMLLVCLVVWIWHRFRPAKPSEPEAESAQQVFDALKHARTTHPLAMELVDFAAWEMQMQISDEEWQ